MFKVDPALQRFVEHFKWKQDRRKSGRIYFYTTLGGRKIYLHRMIFGLFGSFQIDHANNDFTDNTLTNLRPATVSQNMANSVRARGVSPFRGVYLNNTKWAASIRHKGVTKRRYGFDTAEDAARAYDKMALELFGEFAVVNFRAGSNP